ncbi:MAG: hypothetical protein ACRD3S_04360, partial [Terracidiphilus sp.]
MVMNSYFCLAVWLILAQGTVTPTARKFHWDWQNWQELIASQSLRNTKMSRPDRAAITRAIEARIRPEMPDLGIQSEEQLAKAALDTRIKLIDLNQDRVPEVVAQGMADCSATGNCSFWIFQKTSHGYKLLLNGFGQTFTIQEASTNGFRDIVVAEHDSAFESGLTVYRYRGGKYEEAACYDAKFSEDSKEPRVAPC